MKIVAALRQHWGSIEAALRQLWSSIEAALRQHWGRRLFFKSNLDGWVKFGGWFHQKFSHRISNRRRRFQTSECSKYCQFWQGRLRIGIIKNGSYAGIPDVNKTMQKNKRTESKSKFAEGDSSSMLLSLRWMIPWSTAVFETVIRVWFRLLSVFVTLLVIDHLCATVFPIIKRDKNQLKRLKQWLESAFRCCA